MDLDEAARAFREFVAVIKALRTPGTGCPWDLEQTHATLRPYLIEEAYEVLAAIDAALLADRGLPAGIDEGDATFETSAPTWQVFDTSHLAEHRFVALDATSPGQSASVVGWVAAVPRPHVVAMALAVVPPLTTSSSGSGVPRPVAMAQFSVNRFARSNNS